MIVKGRAVRTANRRRPSSAPSFFYIFILQYSSSKQHSSRPKCIIY